MFDVIRGNYSLNTILNSNFDPSKREFKFCKKKKKRNSC